MACICKLPAVAALRSGTGIPYKYTGAQFIVQLFLLSIAVTSFPEPRTLTGNLA